MKHKALKLIEASRHAWFQQLTLLQSLHHLLHSFVQTLTIPNHKCWRHRFNYKFFIQCEHQEQHLSFLNTVARCQGLICPQQRLIYPLVFLRKKKQNPLTLMTRRSSREFSQDDLFPLSISPLN